MYSHSCRILIAIGDETLRPLIDNWMKMLRFHAVYSKNATSTLAALNASEAHDIIVIDDRLSGFAIESVCEAVRRRNHPIPAYIIALVSPENQDSLVPIFAAGADTVLVKPFDMTEFLSHCRLGQRVTALAHHQQNIPSAENEEDTNDASAQNNNEAATSPTAEEEEALATHGYVKPEDRRPLIVQNYEAVLKQTFRNLGVDLGDCISKPATGGLLNGDLIGWQGVYLPHTSEWYDIVFHFNRPGAEHLCSRILQRMMRDDGDLLTAIFEFLQMMQGLYKETCETATGSSTAILCHPLALPRPKWLKDVGPPHHSQLFKFPKLIMVYDFYALPGMVRIKPIANVEPGDVMNETIATAGSRVPLAARGLVLSQDHIEKMVPQLEESRNLWVIEPSLMARRIHANIHR